MVYENVSSSGDSKNRQKGQSGGSSPRVDMVRVLGEAERLRKERRAEASAREQQDREKVQQKGQSGSSSPRVDMVRVLGEAERLRKERWAEASAREQQDREKVQQKGKGAWSEASAREQQDREKVQQKGKEEEKEITYQDLASELLVKLWADKLVKNLHDVEGYNYHDRNAVIDIIAEKDYKSLAPELAKQLTGCSKSLKLEILSAIKRSENQSAVPELVKMLEVDHRDKYDPYDYEMYGAIAGVIGKLGGLSKVQEVLDSDSLEKTLGGEAMKIVKTMLESPSSGLELVEKLGAGPGSYAYECRCLTYGVLRMLGDISVAKKLAESIHYGKSFNVIGEIYKTSYNKKEIKEFSDKLVNMILRGGEHRERGVKWATQKIMFEVAGGLGKRLVQLQAITEANMLSKTLVAMFFSERVGTETLIPESERDVVPSHFDAVFMIEQHLAEQGLTMRVLYPEAMNKKVCEAIVEKMVDYRKGLVGLENVEKFYGKLFEIFSHSEIEEKVRLGMIFSIADRIGEVENKPFMPALLKRLSPALLREDWSSKAYEIYKLSKDSSAKDIGELFEELIEKHPDEQVSPNVQKAIVRLASLVGTRLSLALKLAEKLSDKGIELDLRREMANATGKMGQKLDNQDDIKAFCDKLVNVISDEDDRVVLGKLSSAIATFGDESTALIATFGDEPTALKLSGKLTGVLSYEEINKDVRKKVSELVQHLLIRDAMNSSQEFQSNKPVTDLEAGAIDSSQR